MGGCCSSGKHVDITRGNSQTPGDIINTEKAPLITHEAYDDHLATIKPVQLVDEGQVDSKYDSPSAAVVVVVEDDEPVPQLTRVLSPPGSGIQLAGIVDIPENQEIAPDPSLRLPSEEPEPLPPQASSPTNYALSSEALSPSAKSRPKSPVLSPTNSSPDELKAPSLTESSSTAGGSSSDSIGTLEDMKAALAFLREKHLLKKFTRFGAPQEKEVWLDQSSPVLRWSKPGATATGELQLGAIMEIQKGGKGKLADLSFTIVSKKRKFNFEATTVELRNEWVDCLETVSARYRASHKGSIGSPSFRDDESSGGESMEE